MLSARKTGFFQNTQQKLSLMTFDRHQSLSLTKETALALASQQRAFIQTALAQGFDTSLQPKVRTSIDDLFKQHYQSITTGAYLQNPHSFQINQTELYQAVHTSALTEPLKLFYELKLGLARFDLATQMLFKFLAFKQLVEPETINAIKQKFENSQSLDFFLRLQRMEDVCFQLLNIMLDNFDQTKDIYWQTLKDYFQAHTEQETLARYLVSMQYIPDDRRFLGMAQTLHWLGFGGPGQIYDEFEQLAPLKRHAITYHRSVTQRSPFGNRLKYVEQQLAHIKAHGSNTVTAMLRSQHALGQRLSFCDVCSGPHYAAIQPIITELPDYQIELVVTDVDGNNLTQVCGTTASEENVTITGVRYEDLNMPLPDTGDKFHLVMAGIGLHQLPKDQISTVVSSYARRMAEGGIFINPDVGILNYYQLFFIPINITDREGCIYPYQQLELKTLRSDHPDNENTCILAYPLHRVCTNTTDNAATDFYQANVFVTVHLPKQYLPKLYNLWDSKQYQQADEWVSQHSKINVVELQNTACGNLVKPSPQPSILARKKQ